MSMFPEQPFDEREERYLLAEILKDSPIPPGNLLRVIQAERIQPRWTEIALPYGRSVSACQKAYDNLFSRVFQFALPPLGPAPQVSPTTKARKRPGPSAESSTGLNRELQPRTPGFVTVNEPTEATAYPPGLVETADQRKKKRGRPSKAEIEVRAAEYAARGEPYPHPPPRRSKNPKPPLEGTVSMAPSITFTPVTMGPSGWEASASGKKRTAKAKAHQDVSVAGYGTSASPIQQFRNEAAAPGHTPGAPFQAPESAVSEPVLPAASSAGQDQTMEELETRESYQHRDIQMNPQEGFLNREGPSPELHGVGNDTLQTGSTPHQQHTAEHSSPKAMLSPEHK